MNLVDVAPGVFRVEAPDLKLPLGLRLPIASTIAATRDGGLAVYSPVGFDDATAAAIEQRGEVRHLIAPNPGHHLFLGAASARWSKALVYAPFRGFEKRRGVRVDRVFSDGPPVELAADFDIETIGGAPKLSETVLFHRASGTLICADLLFNVTKPANTMTKLILKVMGTGGGQLAQSRMVGSFVKDRGAAAASAERILAWDVRLVSPCHGEHASVDGRATLAPLFARMGYRA